MHRIIRQQKDDGIQHKRRRRRVSLKHLKMQEFTVRGFVARQRDLLELELNAEQDEEKSIAFAGR
jgi:hypothetical protein